MFQQFRKSFLHPRVFIFILIGTLIIFLTFFTDDNALEIAISGFASVFIGIGVNNFSSIEIHEKEEQKYSSALRQSMEIMELTGTRISRLHKKACTQNCDALEEELADLEQLIDLGIKLMKNENSMN